MGNKEHSDRLGKAIYRVRCKTKNLRRQLRRTVADHASDSFLDTNAPLLVLTKAAQNGNAKEVEDYAGIFIEYSSRLVDVANLVRSISNNADGVKMVCYVAAQIDNLGPEVINAARILAARSGSKVAQEIMEAFTQLWENQVRILTEAVDDITTMDDFLAVSENRILEDVNKCELALQEGDADKLDRTVRRMRVRSARICNVVTAEMSNYDPCIYTDDILEAVKVLNDHVMPKFGQRVAEAVSTISNNSNDHIDENDFIDASRLIYDYVREIRIAVLMNRKAGEDLDPENEELDENYTLEAPTKTNVLASVDEYPNIIGITTAREAMCKMLEEDKQKIFQQVEDFNTKKLKFDRDVAKWDDTGNDIIVLAKQMCMIMTEMTDFTSGRGPLKTTIDIINAAKKISEAGVKLDKSTRKIAEQCPESSTKNDLLVYLQRIQLYCHQLNITSKVKADVQNISGELIVSGLDSATSLIQAARNLMNAVISTVNTSYVASTKYARHGPVASPIVLWKVKTPRKMPLIQPVRI